MRRKRNVYYIVSSRSRISWCGGKWVRDDDVIDLNGRSMSTCRSVRTIDKAVTNMEKIALLGGVPCMEQVYWHKGQRFMRGCLLKESRIAQLNTVSSMQRN